MSIEWGGYVPTLSSDMSHTVVDNTLAPTTVLKMEPFTVKASWDVPLNVAMGINSLHTFRLRMYAESIGPRPDVVLCDPGGVKTFSVNGVVDKTHYDFAVTIDPVGSGLFAEGTAVSGGPDVNDINSSGVYKLAVVLQHLNDGNLTQDSGASDSDYALVFRAP